MKVGRRRKKQRRLLILVAAGLAVAGLALWQHPPRDGAWWPGRGSTQPVATRVDGQSPRVAIVIDDVGFLEGPVLELARIGLPFTFAILPHQRYSRSLASRLSRDGFEVILHMPMEPLGYPALDPGEGAVRVDMSPAEVRRAVESGLADVPQAAGLNNHMGSRTTADRRTMRAVLEVVRSRGLYFLDSRTTRETIGFAMAREMGIPALERGIFLDDQREASYIEGQVLSLLRKARKEKTVVAIGHPDEVTVKILARLADLLDRANVVIVPASELAREAHGEPG